MKMKRSISALSLIFFFLSIIEVWAGENIAQIEIVGNKTVSNAKVISIIKTRAHQPYNENLLNEDVRNLYATGFFSNIEVEKQETPEGIKIIFRLKENPILKEVRIEGNPRVNRARIKKLLDLKEGAFLDEAKLKEGQNNILDFYTKRGFSGTQVEYKIDVDKNNQATVHYIVTAGGKKRIRKIIFKGVKSFKEKRIRKLMRTKQKWWFIHRGILKEETLKDDVKRIEDFYKEHGFSDVEVSYSIDTIGNDVYITITVNEGKQYFVGRVKLEGVEKVPLQEVKKSVTIQSGDIYTERKLNTIINQIKGVYFDRGYIFVQVDPIVYVNPQTEKVDIIFRVTENDIAYVEKIEIRGNVKTKDKVIRRELRIYPGDKFSGEKIRKSRQRLENLGFFEEVNFDREPGSKPNWENLIVNVKEAKTGYFSFGGGYSSIDEFTGFLELRQRNFDYKNWKTFTGGGQDLSLLASFGSITENYEINFTNPWIFDRPVSFGFEGYKRTHEQDEDVGYAYEEDIKGGAIRFGREFNDKVKGSVGYRFEDVTITDIVDDASQDLKDEAGSNTYSTLELTLSYDTRDNVFSPSKGIYNFNSMDFTGSFLGGDKDFVRFLTRVSFYFPLFKGGVLEWRNRLGIAEPFSDTKKIPIYKRFFAGGASTIRGYHERKIGPIDTVTNDPLGGEAMFVTNLEYTYPLIDVLKVAIFYDSGNVWAKRSDFLSGGFKSSIGAGIRVKTPLGPISLDYGWPLDTEPGETGKTGRFHFNVSRGF